MVTASFGPIYCTKQQRTRATDSRPVRNKSPRQRRLAACDLCRVGAGRRELTRPSALCVCVCVRVCVSTERPLFAIRCIELCCERCKAEGKQAECVHMLHLVPMWQSEVAIAMALEPLPMPDNPFVFLVIDPAAGGPQSDYAIVSIATAAT